MKKLSLFLLTALFAVNAFGYEMQTWDYTDGSKETGTRSQYYNLDIYYPETGEGPYPVLIYVGGNAWLASNYKETAYKDAAALLKLALQRGYAVVCPNNRACSSSDHHFPFPFQDARAVVRFLRNNGEGLSEGPRDLDTSFIAFSGYGSGSFDAILMSLARGMNELYSWDLEGTVGDFLDKSSSVDAVADIGCMSAQYENISLYPLLFPDVMEDAGSWSALCYKTLLTKIISISTENWAPIILIHGSSDNIVRTSDVTNEYNALNLRLGDDCELYTHGGGAIFPTDNATFEAVMNFFDRIRAQKAQEQAIENIDVNRQSSNRKFIHDGQMYIIRDGKIFNAIGTQVK